MTANNTIPPGIQRIVRTLSGVALMACGALVMLQHSVLRQGETLIASTLADGVTPGEMYVATAGHSFFWASNTPEMHGLRVTSECTAAFLIGPLLIIAGLVLASGRFSLFRAFVATATSAAILFLANQGRLVLIAWATAKWGVAQGYQWSHTIGGSIVVGVGVAIAITVFLVALSVRHKTRPVSPRPRHALPTLGATS